MSETVEPAAPAARWCVVGLVDSGIGLVDLDANGERVREVILDADEFSAHVAGRELADRPRWVWSDSPRWYPRLLAGGVRVERVYDLRLCRVILARSAAVRDRAALIAEETWDVETEIVTAPENQDEPLDTLFDLDPDLEADAAEPAEQRTGVPRELDAALAEFARQRAALDTADDPARLGLLLAAESAGALIAEELRSTGVPWDVEMHDQLLRDELGPRPSGFEKPERMARLAEEVRAALGDSAANLDSPSKLLPALHRAGIDVRSTSHWELEEHDHPAIGPLLRYKKLARLLSANGWAWIDAWVRDGRYRPVYVPGGVVTGRWASSGGGALQIPRQLRPALRADPGWTLVSADVSQLEPRVLAAMSGDRAMAAAGFGKDLYSGIVDSGIVATRQEAKIAVLGAMYGATTGDSGRLVPRLRRGFPRAMRLVDQAAAVGERGGIVSTWLGRSSPVPGHEWRELQARASLPGANARDEDRARRAARDFGRFTRNFAVQGTAAEWALAWLAELRKRLASFDPLPDSHEYPAERSGKVFARRPHLVFFLHDEVIVHTPLEYAGAVAEAVEASATAAGHLLFGEAPVDFPLDVVVAPRAVKE